MIMRMSPNHLAIGPHCKFNPGKTYEVADDVGRPFVDGGYAVDVTPETQQAAQTRKDASARAAADKAEAAKVTKAKAKAAEAEAQEEVPTKAPPRGRKSRRG